jgi:hypothetical protein
MSETDVIRQAPRDERAVALDAQWARVGESFTVAPARDPVDVEHLIINSAHAAPHDARLFMGDGKLDRDPSQAD